MTDANHYASILKVWQPKVWGSKPTAEMFGTAHGLGCRPGKQALAVAMGLRPEGVTGSQIVGACGNPQLNKMRGLVADALLKREAVPMSPVGHQVYKLSLTAKGGKRVETNVKRAAELEAAGKAEPAEKAKGKKAAVKKAAGKRKAKVQPVVTHDGTDGALPGDGQAGDNAAQATA